MHRDLDLSATPWDYPGTPPAASGLLDGDRFVPRPPADLVDLARDRTLVVAVGSNASPAVMRRKLARHGVGGTVPLVAATMRGIAVGHSAHVSRPGFVAAAPYLAADAVTPVYVTLLDADQMRCLDLTEPNYVRRRLAGGRCALALDGGTTPAEFDLYDSRWGVLARPGAAVVPLGTQTALHALLQDRWPPYQQMHGPETDARDVMARWASDPALRTRVREAFATTGWARRSGLAD